MRTIWLLCSRPSLPSETRFFVTSTTGRVTNHTKVLMSRYRAQSWRGGMPLSVDYRNISRPPSVSPWPSGTSSRTSPQKVLGYPLLTTVHRSHTPRQSASRYVTAPDPPMSPELIDILPFERRRAWRRDYVLRLTALTAFLLFVLV